MTLLPGAENDSQKLRRASTRLLLASTGDEASGEADQVVEDEACRDAEREGDDGVPVGVHHGLHRTQVPLQAGQATEDAVPESTPCIGRRPVPMQTGQMTARRAGASSSVVGGRPAALGWITNGATGAVVEIMADS